MGRGWLLIGMTLLTFVVLPVHAQDSNVTEVLEPDPAFVEALPPDEFAWAEVMEITDQGAQDIEGVQLPFQHLQVRLKSGPEAGATVAVDHGTTFSIRASQLVAVGDDIILAKSYKIDGSSYYVVVDRGRLVLLALLTVLFVGLVVLVAGRRGLSAFLGLALSLVVLIGFVVPQILNGASPFWISILGAAAIALVSMYLAHGFTYQTTVALVSTVLTFVIATSLAAIFVRVLGLSGAGTEEAFLLQIGQANTLDLRGLLLGGIVIGALGVLDDITTSQTAAVAELKRANPALGTRQLYTRGLNVGREHILSLVNTLVLAYAGASLPIFLFFQLNTTTPWWVIVNGEYLSEEIVRTLVGSIALILAVPITSFLAAHAFTRRTPTVIGASHGHRH